MQVRVDEELKSLARVGASWGTHCLDPRLLLAKSVQSITSERRANIDSKFWLPFFECICHASSTLYWKTLLRFAAALDLDARYHSDQANKETLKPSRISAPAFG